MQNIKVKDQFVSITRVETEGRTDTIDRIVFPASAVGNNSYRIVSVARRLAGCCL